MANYQHSLERRSSMLASAMKNRVNNFATALTPPGTRPPFTQTFSKDKALGMILNSWHLPAMQQWMASMDPQSRLELHNALSDHIMKSGLMNSTASPDGITAGGQMSMNKASNMGATGDKPEGFNMIRNLQ